MIEILWQQITAASRLHGSFVNAIDDVDRMHEALFQVRDMFKEQGLVPNGNMVEEHQVLVQLTHVANVGHDGNAIFF